jgi:hypothetical protein
MMGAVAKTGTRIAALCCGTIYFFASVNAIAHPASLDGIEETAGYFLGLIAYLGAATFLIGVGLNVWSQRGAKQE